MPHQKMNRVIPLNDFEAQALAERLDPMRQALIPRVFKTTPRDVPMAVLVTAAKMLQEHPALNPREDIFDQGPMAALIPLKLVNDDSWPVRPYPEEPPRQPVLRAVSDEEMGALNLRVAQPSLDPSQQPDIMGRSFPRFQDVDDATAPRIGSTTLDDGTVYVFSGPPPAVTERAELGAYQGSRPPAADGGPQPAYQVNIRSQLLQLEQCNETQHFAAIGSRHLVSAAARHMRCLAQANESFAEQLSEMTAALQSLSLKLAAQRRELEENEKTISLLRAEVERRKTAHDVETAVSRIEASVDRLDALFKHPKPS